MDYIVKSTCAWNDLMRGLMFPCSIKIVYQIPTVAARILPMLQSFVYLSKAQQMWKKCIRYILATKNPPKIPFK